MASSSAESLTIQQKVKVPNIPKYINIKKTVSILVKKETKTITTKLLNHNNVEYNDNKYTICCIKYNDEYKLFIIDHEDKDKVLIKPWHFAANNYIRHTFYTSEDKTKRDIYLHNFVMDKLTFEGKGQQSTVDHINRIGLDNRKSNLRLVESQSEQNHNQKLRKRTATLPEDSGCY